MKKNSLPSSIWTNPVQFLAAGFGSGAMPWAPGTFGTLAAIPLYWLMKDLALEYYLLITVIAFLAGIYLCGRAAEDFGVHDHGGIVWDEIVGYMITMIAAPAGWLWIAVGFGLFRLFDIVKPWPIRYLDRRIHGGLGIMIDDVLAGVFALAGLHLIHWSGVLSALE